MKLPLGMCKQCFAICGHADQAIKLDCVACVTDRYPAAKMKQFVEELHAKGQHWVAIQDAGIAADKGYKAFDEGTRDRVWITDENGEDYLGQVGANLL